MEIIQVIFTLSLIIGIEAILSFDNAAVLAMIVNRNLPAHQRKKALRYGIIGAFLFRGISLFFVSWIIANPDFGAVFKIIGGLYLTRLGYVGLTTKEDSIEEGNVGGIERILSHLKIGIFWSTVIIVEMVDLVFSLDNLVAVVGLSNNFWIVFTGVIFGIISMRFVTQYFSRLIEKYPGFESAAYFVICLLGQKLFMSGALGYFPVAKPIYEVLHAHWFDLAFSAAMASIFLSSMLFPKKKQSDSQ